MQIVDVFIFESRLILWTLESHYCQSCFWYETLSNLTCQEFYYHYLYPSFLLSPFLPLSAFYILQLVVSANKSIQTHFWQSSANFNTVRVSQPNTLACSSVNDLFDLLGTSISPDNCWCSASVFLVGKIFILKIKRFEYKESRGWSLILFKDHHTP